jgi:hypothetical protein
VPTFADGKCRVISVMDPYGRIIFFLDRDWNPVVPLKGFVTWLQFGGSNLFEFQYDSAGV